MAAQTGRTVNKYVTFLINDSGGTLREIPILSLSGVGKVHDEVDLTALQDAIKGAMSGHPAAPLDVTCPFDNSAAASPPTLSGSHTVLEPLNGLTTPLSIDVRIGIRHTWETGEPQFGITSSAANGYTVTSYNADVTGSPPTCTAHMVPYPGSAAPAWGTAAETAS